MNINKDNIPAPLRLQRVKCPCCREFVDVVSLPEITSRMYFPKEKEDDQHVTFWEWKNPAFRHINPYYYDIHICPKCSFSDFRDEFVNPAINPSNKAAVIKEKFMEESQRANSLVPVFSKKVIPVEMDFSQAVYLYLLTIYIQELLPGPSPQENPRLSRDWKKLARLYLRTSWLFREQAGVKTGEKKPKGHVFDIRSGIEQFLRGMVFLKTSIESFISSMELQQKFEKENNIFKRDIFLNYRANLQRIVSLYSLVNKSALRIREINVEHIEFLKKKMPHMESPLMDFKEELFAFRSSWPGMPTDESECLKKAAEYFRLAADNDRYLSDLEALKMIEFGLMLLSRAKLREELEALFKVFMKRSSDVRTAYMRKKSQAKSMVDQENISVELNKINKVVQDVTYLYK